MVEVSWLNMEPYVWFKRLQHRVLIASFDVKKLDPTIHLYLNLPDTHTKIDHLTRLWPCSQCRPTFSTAATRCRRCVGPIVELPWPAGSSWVLLQCLLVDWVGVSAGGCLHHWTRLWPCPQRRPTFPTAATRCRRCVGSIVTQFAAFPPVWRVSRATAGRSDWG